MTAADRERLSLWERLVERFWGWLDATVVRATQRRLVRDERESRREED